MSSSRPLRRHAALRHAAYLTRLVALVLVFRAFVAEAYVIPSESMVPALRVGDRIFATKFDYGLTVPLAGTKLIDGGAPERGAIAIFIDPRDGDTVLVKRVIGLPGDAVAIAAGGQLTINGRPVKRRAMSRDCRALVPRESQRWLPPSCAAYEEFLGEARYVVFQGRDRRGRVDPPQSFVVPPRQFFVMGDNRDNSSDSRYWGSVPYANLRGKARVIWWSSEDAAGVRWSRLLSPVR